MLYFLQIIINIKIRRQSEARIGFSAPFPTKSAKKQLIWSCSSHVAGRFCFANKMQKMQNKIQHRVISAFVMHNASKCKNTNCIFAFSFFSISVSFFHFEFFYLSVFCSRFGRYNPWRRLASSGRLTLANYGYPKTPLLAQGPNPIRTQACSGRGVGGQYRHVALRAEMAVKHNECNICLTINNQSLD